MFEVDAAADDKLLKVAIGRSLLVRHNSLLLLLHLLLLLLVYSQQE